MAQVLSPLRKVQPKIGSEVSDMGAATVVCGAAEGFLGEGQSCSH